jgi:hypothetical protein
MKAFAEKKIYSAKGLLLPYSDFRLFHDLECPKIPEDKGERMVKYAEGFLDKEIHMLLASVYREYVTNGNRSHYQDPYFLRRDMAVALAVAEAYENNGRFTEKLMDVVWAIMEESTWIIPAHRYCAPYVPSASLGGVFGGNALHGIDLFSAATAATLASVYLLCKDKLDEIDPIICEKMAYMLDERAIKNFLQIEVWWGGAGGERVNNWNPWIVSNILFVAAVMEKDLDIRERVVTKSMKYLDNFLNCYAPDGGCDEGPGYWGAAGASLLDSLELIEDMSGGRISIYDSELIKNIGDYIYKVNITGNRYVNFADCSPIATQNTGMLIRFGEKTNSPFLVSFGKKQAKYGDYFFSHSHMYRSLKWLNTPYVKEENCPMPLYTELPNLEVMTARETSDSEVGMFVGAKGGNNGEMHNHNDCGNFMVYYNGNPVIIDTGVGEYTKQTFSPERYQLWFMQSGYHNLPSFGGVDQRDGSRYKATEVEFDSDARSIKSQLKCAYPTEAGVESYVRRVSFDGTVTVEESVVLNEAKEIDFHMMLAKEPVLTQEGEISLPEGRTLNYDTSLKAELEVFDPVGMNTKHSWGTEKIYRLHFKINTDKCNVTFTIK